MSRPIWRHFDLLSFVITVGLVGVGCAMIYSAYEASRVVPNETLLENTVFRQVLFAVLGLIGYFLIAAIDYHFYLIFNRWLYLLVLGLLLFTLVLGQARFGAQRWVDLTYFGIQPSEFSKILMILVLARVYGDAERDLDKPWPLLTSILLVAAPALLIFLQNSFGIALVMVVTWLGITFFAGVRWRHILTLAGLGVAGLPFLWFRMQPYQQKRILDFAFPDADPSGANYNITQALISIGSGGWWGKGYLQGTQSQLHFLRVRHTDFIFSVWAEEFGFIGSLLLLALFAVLIMRAVRVAMDAADLSGRLIAGGVAVMVFFQAFVNMGINANMLPVTGLPLPLISYGGSSLMTTLLGLGLVQGIGMRARVPESTRY